MGMLLLLPFAGGLPQAVRAAPLSATLAVIYLGAVPAALAYVTWAAVLSRLPAGRAASVLYAVPVMAFLVGWVWLKEVPTPLDVAGGALALAGVVVVNTLGRAPWILTAPPAPAPADRRSIVMTCGRPPWPRSLRPDPSAMVAPPSWRSQS